MAEPALLVRLGASRFPKADLRGSKNLANSSNAICEFITENYPEDVATLNLFDTELKQEEILNEIRSFIRSNPSSDVVFIHYCGHGIVEPQKGYNLVVKNSDADFLASSSLEPQQVIQIVGTGQGAKSKKVFGIFDACFSGSIAKDALNDSTIDSEVKETNENFNMDGGGLCIITSSSSRQISYFEGPNNLTRFTAALLGSTESKHIKSLPHFSFNDLVTQSAKLIHQGQLIEKDTPVPKIFDAIQHGPTAPGNIPLFQNPKYDPDADQMDLPKAILEPLADGKATIPKVFTALDRLREKLGATPHTSKYRKSARSLLERLRLNHQNELLDNAASLILSKLVSPGTQYEGHGVASSNVHPDVQNLEHLAERFAHKLAELKKERDNLDAEYEKKLQTAKQEIASGYQNKLNIEKNELTRQKQEIAKQKKSNEAALIEQRSALATEFETKKSAFQQSMQIKESTLSEKYHELEKSLIGRYKQKNEDLRKQMRRWRAAAIFSICALAVLIFINYPEEIGSVMNYAWSKK